MRIIQCEQGSQEWINARLGVPTASQFAKILTPKTRTLSAQSDAYMHELVAEWICGYQVMDDTTLFMDRGKQLEPEAVKFYELQKECDTEAVGFVLGNGERYGASPDRLVEGGGLLEVKCPMPATHVKYLLTGDMGEYNCQIQGQLLVCEREWCDRISYHPDMPPLLVRVRRDDLFIKSLETALDQFCDKLAFAKEQAKAIGCVSALEAVA